MGANHYNFHPIRIVLHVFATLVALVGFFLVAAAILSTGWQIMVEPGTGNIHQHGLWADYIMTTMSHIAGAPGPGYEFENRHPPSPENARWIMTFKFGDAVIGDEVHRAVGYQIYALTLLTLTLVFTIMAMIVSYCATWKLILGIVWAIFLFIGVILGAIGLIQFYVATMLPEYRFVYTDRLIQQYVGYSFYRAVAGLACIMVAFFTSVAVDVLIFFIRRNGNGNGNGVMVGSERRPDQTKFFTVTSENKNGIGNGNGNVIVNGNEKVYGNGNAKSIDGSFSEMPIYFPDFKRTAV